MQHLFTYGPIPVTEHERVALQESEIGPLPAHWRVVRLGEVALLERGLSWSKADEGSNGIGVLSIPDILTNGRLNPFPRVHLSKQVTSNKLLVKGDILLVGSSGSAENVGRSGILREEPTSPLAFASFESSAKSRNFTNPMPGVEAAGGPGIAMAAPESP